MKGLLGFLAILFIGAIAQARVFDLSKATFAAYFGGTFGSASTGDAAFANSSGTGTKFDKSVSSAAGGEVGLLFSSERFNFKVGGEYLLPRTQEGVTGTDNGGTQLFLLTSKIAAFVPKATIEFMFKRMGSSRFSLGMGYGWAIVTLDNTYTMTTAGEAALATGSFIESSKSFAPLVDAYVSFETTFTDTVSLALHGGYRYLKVSTLKATKDFNGFGRTVTEGQDLRNGDGSLRALDLGGAFAGMEFRFYF